jgi:hypothetical protein
MIAVCVSFSIRAITRAISGAQDVRPEDHSPAGAILTKERFRWARVDVLEYSILRQSGNSVFGLTVGTENVVYDVCTRITRRVAVAKAFADFQSEVTHQLDLQIRTPFPSWARIFVFAFCQEAEAKQPSRRR